eukprot:320087_1
MIHYVLLALILHTQTGSSLHGSAIVSVNIDNSGTISVANDGASFRPIGSTNNWQKQLTMVIPAGDITPSTIIQFECKDAGGIGGFIANVKYNNIDYYTTKPIHASLFTLISSSDGATSPLVYKANGAAPWGGVALGGIPRKAFWIWNNRVNNVMVFRFHFAPILRSGDVLIYENAGPIQAVQGQGNIGYYPVGNCMRFQFVVKFRSWCKDDWCSIFHGGDDSSSSAQGSQRMPGVWMHKGARASGKFHVVFTHVNSPNPTIDVGPSGGLALQMPYAFDISLTQSSLTVIINSEVVYNNQKYPRHCVSGDTCHGVRVGATSGPHRDWTPFQIGQRWYGALAGTVSDIMIYACGKDGEKMAREKAEKERKERERQEAIKREEARKRAEEERKRKERERKERERRERERKERERKERERKERKERERIERERAEAERRRKEKERKERERRKKQWEKEQKEKEKAEKERQKREDELKKKLEQLLDKKKKITGEEGNKPNINPQVAQQNDEIGKQFAWIRRMTRFPPQRINKPKLLPLYNRLGGDILHQPLIYPPFERNEVAVNPLYNNGAEGQVATDIQKDKFKRDLEKLRKRRERERERERQRKERERVERENARSNKERARTKEHVQDIGKDKVHEQNGRSHELTAAERERQRKERERAERERIKRECAKWKKEKEAIDGLRQDEFKTWRIKERVIARRNRECMKHEILMAMRSSFKKDNERTMLLEKIYDLKHQQHELELQYKLSQAKKQQQKELHKESNLMMEREMEWQKNGETERHKQMRETQRLLGREYKMRVKEHKDLMNGINGFLMAFRHVYQGDEHMNTIV